MPEGLEADKRGYLLEDFRLFCLKDTSTKSLEYHYHEFDKIILLLGGRVTYMVEGVTYFLRPWDLLLVPRSQIHRAVIDPAEPYERMVLWLGREWLDRRSDPDEPLSLCFDLARSRGFHLLRAAEERRPLYLRRFQELEEALRSQEYGARRMAVCCMIQLHVHAIPVIYIVNVVPDALVQLPAAASGAAGAAPVRAVSRARRRHWPHPRRKILHHSFSSCTCWSQAASFA